MQPRISLLRPSRSIAIFLGLLAGQITVRATADSTDDPGPRGQYGRYRMVLTEAGEAHQRQAQRRVEILSGLARREFSYPPSPGWHTSLTVAEDTLVVPLFAGGTLRGLDAATGRTRWEARGIGSHLATPSIWHHDGRDCVLTANTSGQMRLIDPQDGKGLWKVDGLGGSYSTFSPSGMPVKVTETAEKRGRD